MFEFWSLECDKVLYYLLQSIYLPPIHYLHVYIAVYNLFAIFGVI